MKVSRLDRSFFHQHSADLARALIGKALVCGDRAGIIVETEAYLDERDRASHARFGKTKRNAVMFGPGGAAYVYLCYGMHQMMNVVAGKDGKPGAVLLRALAPLVGLGDAVDIARGPGKLTRALGISRKAHNGACLATDPRLYIGEVKDPLVPTEIACGPRIGIDYAGEWAEAPLRFWIDDHPAVSGPRPSRAKRSRKRCLA